MIKTNQSAASKQETIDFIEQNEGVEAESTLSTKSVEAYLKQHPDFFIGREDLLAQLTLQHDTGEAVSLVERQVGVLRDRNLEMRNRLRELLDTVRDNNHLFDKTKRLNLDLLDCADLGAVYQKVIESFKKDFHFSLCSLILFTDNAKQYSAIRAVSVDEAQEYIASLLKEKPTLGRALREDQLTFLFGDSAKDVGSSAVVPLGGEEPMGVLAIASKDDHHFHSNMDTLFLTYIAEMLTRVITRYLK